MPQPPRLQPAGKIAWQPAAPVCSDQTPDARWDHHACPAQPADVLQFAAEYFQRKLQQQQQQQQREQHQQREQQQQREQEQE
jgi:hypothetical protein